MEELNRSFTYGNPEKLGRVYRRVYLVGDLLVIVSEVFQTFAHLAQPVHGSIKR